jgi:hypothetical protein
MRAMKIKPRTPVTISVNSEVDIVFLLVVVVVVVSAP